MEDPKKPKKATNVLQNLFSLKTNCKNRLRTLFHSLKSSNNIVSSFLLVLDEKMVRIISSLFKMIELMEFGVTALEKLELKRKRFPKMQAIYMLTPTSKSIDLLLDDFSNKSNPQYGLIHLFFSSKLPDDLMEKLAINAELMNRVQNFKEFDQEFLCAENHLFDLNLSESLPYLYSMPNSPELNQFIENLGIYLSTIIPSIDRFSNCEIIYLKTENQLCYKIAKVLQLKIKKEIEKMEGLKSENLDPCAGKLSFFLFDRSIDLISPLMHDFFYQPMIYDLLDIKGNIAEVEDEDKNGKKIIRKSVLTENDDVFEKYRYKHIAEVLDGIPNEFQNFVSNNSNAKLQQGALSDLDLGKMSEIIKKMPQYNEILKKYTTHMKLIEKAYSNFEDRDIREVGELEQSLATGIDREGEAIRPVKLLSLVGARLGSSKLTPDEKLRLVLLVCLSLNVSTKDREALIELLEPENRSVVSKMEWMISNRDKVDSKKKGKSKKQSDEMRKLAKSKITSATVDLCRYSNFLENFLEAIIDIIKKGKDVKDIKGYEIESIKVWNHPDEIKNSPAKNKKLKLSAEDEQDAFKTPKLIVFGVGGIGYNEIRSVMEIANNAENLIIMTGGTNIIRPNDYLEGLRKMKEK